MNLWSKFKALFQRRKEAPPGPKAFTLTIPPVSGPPATRQGYTRGQRMLRPALNRWTRRPLKVIVGVRYVARSRQV